MRQLVNLVPDYKYIQTGNSPIILSDALQAKANLVVFE